MVKIKYASCRAKLISDRVGRDFVRIETVQTYPTEYNELAFFAKNERYNNIKSVLKDLDINIDDYDTISIQYGNIKCQYLYILSLIFKFLMARL